MTTVKTEIFKIGAKNAKAVFETIYAGNQNFIYKINGKVFPAEFFFMFKNDLPFVENVKKIK